MRTTVPLSITLPKEMAAMVKAKVASGQYATESEVIREGLRDMMAYDAALEHWLRTEVVASIKESKAHPERLIPIEKVMERFQLRKAKVKAEPADQS